MLYRGRDKKQFYLASLLYDSIDNRHIDSINFLLNDKGADPNIVLPRKGISSFHFAVGGASEEFARKVVTLILQNGGDPNVRSDEGLTPVHIAAACGRYDILALLLDNGGDPRARDIVRKTPLDYATREGFRDCLALLEARLAEEYDDYAVVVDPESCKNRCSRSCNCCCVTLDKIIVNNGAVVGEYRAEEPAPIDCSINNSSSPIIRKSIHLPQTDSDEYISNWFDGQKRSGDGTDKGSDTDDSLIYSDSSSRPYGGVDGNDDDNGSLAETDRDELEAKRYDHRYITFRKVYRKRRRKTSRSPGSTTSVAASSVSTAVLRRSISKTTSYENTSGLYSRESGIMTLETLDNSNLELSRGNDQPIKLQDKSSDYLSGSRYSTDSAVSEVTDDLGKSSVRFEVVDERSKDPARTVLAVAEVYKCVDDKEGIVLYEKRLLKQIGCGSEWTINSRPLEPSTLPASLDYDPERSPDSRPSIASIKKVHLQKVHRLDKENIAAISRPIEPPINRRVYSAELEKVLGCPDRCNNTAYSSLENQLVSQFRHPDPSRKWRGGVTKARFNCILLDPRIVDHLPDRAANVIDSEACWRTFLSAIFFVGSATRCRPYRHLYDAVPLWKRNEPADSGNTNRQRGIVLDIWKSGRGVICLRVFQHVVPAEASTRQAAMIAAIGFGNLTNSQSGVFYGLSTTWTEKQRQMLGVYLLYKAMEVFLAEGERQLYPHDVTC